MQRAVLAVALALCSALPGLALAEDETITGSAGYREPIALPPEAVLEVSLQDVSRADAAATVLSSQRFAMSAVPHPFSLRYDPELIDDRFSYTVSAKITVGDKVLFRTTSHNAVLTRGAGGDIDLMLEKMPATNAGVQVSNGAGELAGTSWEVFELGGRMLVTESLPTLQFGQDNRVGVHAGCNRFSGGYTQDLNSLSFTANMAGTMMACPPPYDELERDFIETLSQVTGLVFRNDQMALVNQHGVTVMRTRLAN